MNSRSRVVRTLRMAISAPANSPLPTKKASTITISMPMRAGAHLTLYVASDVGEGSTSGQELHHAGWREEATCRARSLVDSGAPARDARGRGRRSAGRSLGECRVHLRQAPIARDRPTR